MTDEHDDQKTPVKSGSSESTKPAPERAYTVVGAVGDAGVDPDTLQYRVIGKTKAPTQAAAKDTILASNPEFPGLNPIRDGQPDGDHQTIDLQSLVRGKRLWLRADSGWDPKLVTINQPPPKFEGL